MSEEIERRLEHSFEDDHRLAVSEERLRVLSGYVQLLLQDRKANQMLLAVLVEMGATKTMSPAIRELLESQFKSPGFISPLDDPDAADVLNPKLIEDAYDRPRTAFKHLLQGMSKEEREQIENRMKQNRKQP